MPLGKSGRIIVTVTGTARIVDLTANLSDGETWSIDLLGDGALVAGIRYTPTKKGVYNLRVTASDANGCVGSTGLRRMVTVP